MTDAMIPVETKNPYLTDLWRAVEANSPGGFTGAFVLAVRYEIRAAAMEEWGDPKHHDVGEA